MTSKQALRQLNRRSRSARARKHRGAVRYLRYLNNLPVEGIDTTTVYSVVERYWGQRYSTHTKKYLRQQEVRVRRRLKDRWY